MLNVFIAINIIIIVILFPPFLSILVYLIIFWFVVEL